MSPLTGGTQLSVVAFSDPFLLCIQKCGLPFWSYLTAEYIFFLAEGSVCFQCFTAAKPAQRVSLQAANVWFVLVYTPAKLQLALIDGVCFSKIIFNNVDNRREDQVP